MSQKMSVAELIEQTVLKGSGRVVSTADLIFLVREMLPACEHSDEELAQLIAAIAIQHGCNVAFCMSCLDAQPVRRLGQEAANPSLVPSSGSKTSRLPPAANDHSPDDRSATG